jgi:FkbM family methyltransferase
MRRIKYRLSMAVKKKVMAHYLIPFSETGLDEGLVRFLGRDAPINLVDIGASSGEFTNTIAAYCGLRHALLIEPQPSRAAQLSKSHGGRFTIEQCAVSDITGTSEMEILAFDHASSLLPVRRADFGIQNIYDVSVRERIRVRVRRIDDIVATLPWASERIDLLKIDVQGAELLALRGAVDTLKRINMIWTEISFRPMYEGSALFPDIHAFLTEAGFILLWLSQGFRGENRELLQGDALFAKPKSRL